MAASQTHSLQHMWSTFYSLVLKFNTYNRNSMKEANVISQAVKFKTKNLEKVNGQYLIKQISLF